MAWSKDIGTDVYMLKTQNTMKKYILAKDLPDHPAGTELVDSGENTWMTPERESSALTEFDESDLQRAVETGWVKEVDDRRGVYQQMFDEGDAFFIIQNDMRKFTIEEITLMEKALNGELMEKVDLEEFGRWYDEDPERYSIFNHAELLEAFNAREK